MLRDIGNNTKSSGEGDGVMAQANRLELRGSPQFHLGNWFENQEERVHDKHRLSERDAA